jgi:DNA-binding GntR family transcriptional regulator
MCGRAVRKGREPPQQVELLLAKPRDIRERLRSGQNRQQNQKQHFRQRIIHLAGLPIVRQIVEVIKEARRFGNRREGRPIIRHRHAPP